MSEAFNNEDFRVEDGKLRLARRGYVAVVIMSKTPESIQLVKTLASLNVTNLQTGYLDISQGQNRQVVLMSKNTPTYIQSAPYLAFFADGKLKCRYKGDVNKKTMTDYFQDKIIEAAQQQSSTVRKSETVSSSNAANFAMANKNTMMGGGKQLPIPKDSAFIGFNRAWLADQQQTK